MPIDDTDLGNLPDQITPGDNDANSPTTYVLSRLQAWTGSVWKRVKIGLAVAADSLTVVQATDRATVTGDEKSQFYPAPGAVRGAPRSAAIDPLGTLQIRGPVLTDEESFRDDFKGVSLLTSLTGTLTFANGQTAVTGSGTAFTIELTNQSYVRLTADANSALARVSEVVSDVSLVLDAAYTGSSSSGAAVKSNWQIATPAGASITVGSSLVNLVANTTSGDVVSISRTGDYLPMVKAFRGSVSQRITNQNVVVGLVDTFPAPNQQAVLLLNGTDPTVGSFRTSNGSAAADTEITTFLYPTGLDSSKSILYEIDLSENEASLRVNGSIVATNTTHLPDPYQVLSLAAYEHNTGATGSATTLSLDVVWFHNVDAVNVERAAQAQPIPVRIAPPLTPDATRGIIFGDIALNSTTTAAVRRTAYTEQSANFTGSVISSNANDSSAGTGARTIRIIYYDSTGAGPFAESATMNGITSVPLTAANKCFIERIEVVTRGSTLSNVGTITLRNDAVATVWSVAPTDNQTFGAHHYVAAGKTAYVLDLYTCSSSVATNTGSSVVLRVIPIGIADAAERQVTDTVNVGGASTGVPRPYPSQIPIAGPARILAYVTTLNNANTVYRASFTVSES